jgi:hypothetical protein
MGACRIAPASLDAKAKALAFFYPHPIAGSKR